VVATAEAVEAGGTVIGAGIATGELMEAEEAGVLDMAEEEEGGARWGNRSLDGFCASGM